MRSSFSQNERHALAEDRTVAGCYALSEMDWRPTMGFQRMPDGPA